MQVRYRAPLSALLRSGKLRHKSLDEWPKTNVHGPEEVTSPHGKLKQIIIDTGPDANGLYFRIEFALAEDHPIFLWRLTVDNRSQYAVKIDQLKMMQAGFFPKRKLLPNPGPLSTKYKTNPVGFGTIRPHPDPGALAFFSNGWQSWSFTGALGADESHPDTRLGFFAAPMWFNPGTPRPRKFGHFGSDMFGILGDRQHRTGILVGFLSQKQHFGSLEANTDPLYPALALWANGDQAQLLPGAQMTTDWAAIQFVEIDSLEPVKPYLEAVAREHLPHQLSGFRHKSSVGWCSWYQFYQDISEEKMRTNLQSAAEIKDDLPFDLFQIDDGFQAQIGDWLEFDPDFPNGVAPLAEAIEESEFTPGLWLAPFIVHSKAKLNRQHRDWFLRNRYGFKVNAGFVWNNFNKALDLSHPEALNYTQKVIRTAVHDWGFRFLKLDFLFAAALAGRFRDRTRTRAQLLRKGLEGLREAAGPDTHLLGCGVPLGSSIGIFDSMRIGPDVDPSWYPSILGIKGPLRREPSMPSTRNAIQNTLTRAFMHQRWWINDPDCLMVRPDSELTLDEVHSLASVIALTGGPLLLSDDLPKLPTERLRIAKQLVPLIEQRPQVMDWFDTATPRLLRLDLENVTGKWHLMAVFNWDDEEQDVSLPLEKFALSPGIYFAREFWNETVTQISDGLLILKSIPAHGVKLLALRPAQTDQACYLGSDLHISQGLEVAEWLESSSKFNFRLGRPGKASGQVDLYLPRKPERVIINQKEIIYELLGEGIYRLPVDFEQIVEIEIV
jgi:alpha-galactosidase